MFRTARWSARRDPSLTALYSERYIKIKYLCAWSTLQRREHWTNKIPTASETMAFSSSNMIFTLQIPSSFTFRLRLHLFFSH
ncbi:Uncharacterized protein HZ326_11475 [Fusarium oxysporum f. sp. albedinis]|nr:Uncharacterized protein HZ326_11475 [Fusarium oxysporum f. sp. albedinis]